MLKILQGRLQHYVSREIPDVQVGFRKGRGPRAQIANTCWITEKAREFQKNIYFCFIDSPKPLTMWMTTNCGKFFKRWECQTTCPASLEICMQVKKQQLELGMEQQTGSKLETPGDGDGQGGLACCSSWSRKESNTTELNWTEALSGASLVAQRLKHLPEMRETQVPSWVGKIPWRRKWQPTPVLLPGESHGRRSLVGYSPWGRKESDMTEWLHFTSLLQSVTW